jgi:hypothetical protein
MREEISFFVFKNTNHMVHGRVHSLTIQNGFLFGLFQISLSLSLFHPLDLYNTARFLKNIRIHGLPKDPSFSSTNSKTHFSFLQQNSPKHLLSGRMTRHALGLSTRLCSSLHNAGLYISNKKKDCPLSSPSQSPAAAGAIMAKALTAKRTIGDFIISCCRYVVIQDMDRFNGCLLGEWGKRKSVKRGLVRGSFYFSRLWNKK